MQPAIAYAHLPVHGVTPVLDKQRNKQTNKQFNKFLLSDFFQILSEFALVNTSFRVKILCITSEMVKISPMVLMYLSLSKIRASRFVKCAHPTPTGE